MYWPLIGGFIAFVLLAVLLGWIMDPDRHRDEQLAGSGGGRCASRRSWTSSA